MFRTSCTPRSLEILLLSIDVAKHDDVGSSGGDSDDGTKICLLSRDCQTKAIRYLTSEARLAFTQLKQAFNKALILQHFDLECHLQIETDASGYNIKGVSE